MSTITTRSGKGSPLTNNEVDTNFTNLNTDKLESADLAGYAELTGATFTGEVEATGFNGDLTGAILFKGQAGEALTKGDPVYISGISGNKTVVSKADANDANKMPCFGIVDATVSANADCSVVTFGTLQGLDTSSFSEGDELFVSDTGTLTTTAPTGESSQIQKIGKVTRSHASAGSIKVMGAGRTNAVPNLNDGQFFLGNGSNQAVSTDFTTSVLGEISAGTGIGISGSGVISNSAPDQTVSLTGAGTTTVSGTYPNFTITGAGTTYTAGTGITLTGTEFSLTDTNAKLNLTGGTITSGTGTGLKVNHDTFQEGIISYRNHATLSPSYVFENASGRTGTLYTQNDFPMWRDGTTSNSYKVWTQGNDGSGSGLDADTVDGVHASSFLRTDADDTASGTYSFTSSYNEFGNSTGSVSNDGGWNARVNVAGSSHARLDVKAVGDGIITTVYSHNGQNEGKVGTYSNHQLALMANGTTGATLNTSGDFSSVRGIGVSNTSSSSPHGLSLYAGAMGGQPTYGMMFAGRATFGGHGALGASDWATYFTMNDTTTRGWIFRRGSTNVASVQSNGVLELSNECNAYAYKGTSNVSGTGDASYHPNGIYSTGTNWLYGTQYMNGYDTNFSGGNIRSVDDIVSDQNYGYGLVGLYSSYRYQHVWSMGAAYRTNASGTSYGNMYGLTFTHTNVGTGTNQSISGLSHQLQLRMNGTLYAAIGNGIWSKANITAYSDISVKTNLEVIPNALEKVCQINGYTYDRTDYEPDSEGIMPETRQAGVVAQEVEKILPEVVSGEEGNKAVAYGNMVSILIEAIKELKAEVDDLKTELVALKGE